MPFDAPFQLGPFLVSDGGRLALAQADSLPRFHLDWCGCRVDAQLVADGAHPLPGAGPEGELRLRATVGRVPSTALCGRDEAGRRREEVFTALRSLPANLPEGWQVTLLADHRVVVLSAAKVAMPTTATALLTDVTMFLLALAPYLELLDEIGVEVASAGTVKT